MFPIGFFLLGFSPPQDSLPSVLSHTILFEVSSLSTFSLPVLPPSYSFPFQSLIHLIRNPPGKRHRSTCPVTEIHNKCLDCFIVLSSLFFFFALISVGLTPILLPPASPSSLPQLFISSSPPPPPHLPPPAHPPPPSSPPSSLPSSINQHPPPIQKQTPTPPHPHTTPPPPPPPPYLSLSPPPPSLPSPPLPPPPYKPLARDAKPPPARRHIPPHDAENGTKLSKTLCHPGAGRDPVAPSMALFSGFRPAPE